MTWFYNTKGYLHIVLSPMGGIRSMHAAEKTTSLALVVVVAVAPPWPKVHMGGATAATDAARLLQQAMPAQFPLAQLQAITNALIRTTVSATSSALRRKSVAPFTQECDILLSGEVAALSGEMYTQEAGILACLHAFTHEQARGQLFMLRPDEKNRMSSSTKGWPCIFRSWSSPARPTLKPVPAMRLWPPRNCLPWSRATPRIFPPSSGSSSPWRTAPRDALLPTELISMALKRSHYHANLRKELDGLRHQKRWLSAYKLVSGLRDTISLPKADSRFAISSQTTQCGRAGAPASAAS